MNARHVVKMSVFALLLSPALVLAQGLKGDQTLPDLVPADLAVDKVCAIVVTIRNDGPAIVPDAGYSLSRPGSSGVQIYKGGAPWGGIVLGGLDRSHLSQPVGGRVSYTFPGLTLAGGTHEVRVDVDNNNSIAEANELNNSLTKILTCQIPLPDLASTNISLETIGIQPNSPCQIVITLKNNGPGIVPDAAFAHTLPNPTVQMYIDGAPLGGTYIGSIDPSKVLQPAGATLTHPWFPLNPNMKVSPGEHVLRVDVDGHDTLVESNEVNNSLTQTLVCGIVTNPGVAPPPSPPLPDLVATNISLEQVGIEPNSPCQIVITLKNNGPGSVPDAAFAQTAPNPTIQMYKGGAGWGGAALVTIDPAKVLQPAGATLVYPWMAPVATLKVAPGEHVLRVDVDNFNRLVESNEANNSLTKTVTCGIVNQTNQP